MPVKDTILVTDVWVPHTKPGADTLFTVKPGDPAVRHMADVLATLEEQMKQLVLLPPDFKDKYLDMFELGTDYYNMTGDELKNWLEKKGLTFSKEKQQVAVLVVYDDQHK